MISAKAMTPWLAEGGVDRPELLEQAASRN
jgi:hypothetical protein